MSKRKAKLKKHKDFGLLLAVDVGNTYIHFAVFQGKRIITTSRVDSQEKNLAPQVKKALKKLSGKKISNVVICSVVPKLTHAVQSLIQKELGLKARVIGKDMIVPVKNLYKSKQVGQDRLVCTYAATRLYGKPAIVIDLGTAITLDAISSRREYLGGIIVPGIRITTETLFERTALLPLVEFEMPKSLIGRDTKTSILSGIYYGYGEMLKGLIGLLKKKVSPHAKVIITGGHAKLMAEYIKEKVDFVDQDLVLKGIALLVSK